MVKEALVVGVSAAAGEFVARKYGTSIEAKAVEMKIPAALAHAAVVGTFAVGGYLIAKAVL